MKRRKADSSSQVEPRNRLSLSEITKQNVELIAALEASANQSRSLGEHLADLAAAIVGSWTFLIIQTGLLVLWVIVNLLAWSAHWDPYPFVLLNLVLSFQAAFATPMILMSQNRQTRMSERRNELDLQINLLAEQENTEQLRLLRLICEKLQIALENSEVHALAEPAEPLEIVRQIVTTFESQRSSSDAANH